MTATSRGAAFQIFVREATRRTTAWMNTVLGLPSAGVHDAKTFVLFYLAGLAALRFQSGVTFHAAFAKQAGAKRE